MQIFNLTKKIGKILNNTLVALNVLFVSHDSEEIKLT